MARMGHISRPCGLAPPRRGQPHAESSNGPGGRKGRVTSQHMSGMVNRRELDFLRTGHKLVPSPLLRWEHAMRTTGRIRAIVTTTAALGAMLALSATAALAQYPPAEDFGVSCTPSSPQPGESVDCTVVGAQSGESLSATAEVQGVIYEDSFEADGDGEAAFAFDVPGDRDAGASMTVTVAGDQSGETSDEVVLAADEADPDDEDVDPVDVADDEDERLPVTGGQIVLLTGLGVALLGGGGALVLRKRNSAV